MRLSHHRESPFRPVLECFYAEVECFIPNLLCEQQWLECAVSKTQDVGLTAEQAE
jgi:hypothetical protein